MAGLHRSMLTGHLSPVIMPLLQVCSLMCMCVCVQVHASYIQAKHELNMHFNSLDSMACTCKIILHCHMHYCTMTYMTLYMYNVAGGQAYTVSSTNIQYMYLSPGSLLWLQCTRTCKCMYTPCYMNNTLSILQSGRGLFYPWTQLTLHSPRLCVTGSVMPSSLTNTSTTSTLSHPPTTSPVQFTPGPTSISVATPH